MQFVSLLANIILETIKRQQFPELELDSEELACGVLQGTYKFSGAVTQKVDVIVFICIHILHIVFFIYFFRRTRGVTITKFETAISLKQTKHQHLYNVRRTLIEETVKCKVMTITVFFYYFLIEQP